MPKNGVIFLSNSRVVLAMAFRGKQISVSRLFSRILVKIMEISMTMHPNLHQLYHNIDICHIHVLTQIFRPCRPYGRSYLY